MRKLIFSLQLIVVFFSIDAQELRIETTDGVELYINIKGTGTPCLLLHGGPGMGSYWFEKIMGDSLEQHFQMIYLDQRGVGRSTSPEDKNYSLERMVKDFEEVRTYLGIEQWIIFGHSFGGVLQMGYANRHPESIKGMLMINCTLNITQSYTESWCPKACEFLNITNIEPYLDESKPIMEGWGSLISQLKEKKLMWKMGYSSPENMALSNTMFGDMEFPDWNSDYANIGLEMKEYWIDFKKFTGNMKMPVLFFYGKKDWMIGPEHYKGVNFSNAMFWSSDVEHMQFIDNIDDLTKAIRSYQKKYNL